MPIEEQECRCKMLCCQLNNVSMKEVSEVKMSVVTLQNTKYDRDVELFAKIVL